MLLTRYKPVTHTLSQFAEYGNNPIYILNEANKVLEFIVNNHPLKELICN